MKICVQYIYFLEIEKWKICGQFSFFWLKTEMKGTNPADKEEQPITI